MCFSNQHYEFNSLVNLFIDSVLRIYYITTFKKHVSQQQFEPETLVKKRKIPQTTGPRQSGTETKKIFIVCWKNFSKALFNNESKNEFDFSRNHRSIHMRSSRHPTLIYLA